jgi:hypothetical protein
MWYAFNAIGGDLKHILFYSLQSAIKEKYGGWVCDVYYLVYLVYYLVYNDLETCA